MNGASDVLAAATTLPCDDNKTLTASDGAGLIDYCLHFRAHRDDAIPAKPASCTALVRRHNRRI
jgi:hypothetical protein